MARKGRVDRGLVLKRDAAGKKVWYVRLYHHGKEEWFGGFSKKTEARQFYEKAKVEQSERRFFPQRHQQRGSETLADVLDRYTATLDGCGKVKTTIAQEKTYAAWWKTRLPDVRLHTLTGPRIDDVKRDLTVKGLSPQTVVHYLKFLRHALYATIGKAKLLDNPFDSVKLPKVRATKTRYLSREEETTLCEAIGPVYAPWVRLAILTGMRRQEQFSLRWSNVDFDLGLLTLPTTKSGGVQYVYLNEAAKGVLRRLLTHQIEQGHCGEWVFPSENPVRHLDTDNFYGRIFLPAIRTAKLEGVTWHCLRHTFASRLAMSGQNASTIAELLRHSGLDLVRRYAHLSPTHLKHAVETVASYGQGESGTVIKPEPAGEGQGGTTMEVVENRLTGFPPVVTEEG
jgi:integrase